MHSRDTVWRAAVVCVVAVLGGACASEEPATTQTQNVEGITLQADVQAVTRVEDALQNVFIPPFLDCRAPKPGETGSGPDGKVCTPVAISGCTEPGKYFPDYASCEIVRTQRPYWPAPPAAEPRPDDPRLQDAAFMSELQWVTQQVAASGCTCCHDGRVTAAGQWDISRGPIWLDTLSDPGLALFAGLADSSTLGAYPSAENHGFDRMLTGIPTTDTPRMKAFLNAELRRRGISEEQARAVPPFGGPIYANRVAKPDACRDRGFGVDPSGRVHFGTATARYVYVLENGSNNPGVPPNLDKPAGTIWRLDVLPSATPLASGLVYGTTPQGSFQSIPERERAPELQLGRPYQLYVLRDVGIPAANCVFTFGDAVEPPPPTTAAPPPAADSGGVCALPGGDAQGFGASCSDGQNHSDCTCAADYCALMPGQNQGTCTRQGCKEDPSVCPAGYSCLDLSLFSPGLPSICRK